MGNSSNNITKQIATFIVDKRNAFYLIFIVAVIYCASSVSKVSVNNDITAYLLENTETRIGIDLMEEEFVTYGAAKIMVANITYEKAKEIVEHIEKI